MKTKTRVNKLGVTVDDLYLWRVPFSLLDLTFTADGLFPFTISLSVNKQSPTLTLTKPKYERLDNGDEATFTKENGELMQTKTAETRVDNRRDVLYTIPV